MRPGQGVIGWPSAFTRGDRSVTIIATDKAAAGGRRESADCTFGDWWPQPGTARGMACVEARCTRCTGGEEVENEQQQQQVIAAGNIPGTLEAFSQTTLY